VLSAGCRCTDLNTKNSLRAAHRPINLYTSQTPPKLYQKQQYYCRTTVNTSATVRIRYGAPPCYGLPAYISRTTDRIRSVVLPVGSADCITFTFPPEIVPDQACIRNSLLGATLYSTWWQLLVMWIIPGDESHRHSYHRS
jgi:hypothetical protein